MNDIVNEDSDIEENETSQSQIDNDLAAWVMQHVEDWERERDDKFEESWKAYYRLWKGEWAPEDSSRQSERSRLIAPALMQAIEQSVADLEEAYFGRAKWFDLTDDVVDDVREDIERVRDLLLEDFDTADVPAAICEIILMAAIFGTGIGKLIVDEETSLSPTTKTTKDDLGRTVVLGGVDEVENVIVRLEPIAPDEFVIDTGVTKAGTEGINQGLGCAHVTFVPKHTIQAKQNSGIYKDTEITSDTTDTLFETITGKRYGNSTNTDLVKIVEYHGLVPAEFLIELEEGEEVLDLGVSTDVDETNLVEAHVTIANGSTVLKAIKNPLMMQDRPFIAFQFDSLPRSFWGRGIAEKGFNSQKALDAELRARVDAMAFAAHPMMAVDGTAMPRGFKPEVYPGKTFITQGPPSAVFQQFKFSDISASTFHQSGELERMVSMATGQVDMTAPSSVNPKNNPTASGQSMAVAPAIKRAKRTLRNIENSFLTKLIKKSAWRYMQFNPERYKTMDVKFTVQGAMGVMAREIEQTQLTYLLSIVPSENPAFGILLQGIIENSSITQKEAFKKEIAKAFEPNPNAQKMQQLAEQEAMLKLEKLDSEIRKNGAETAAKTALSHYHENRLPVEMQKQNTAIDADFAIQFMKDEEAKRKEFRDHIKDMMKKGAA